MSIEAQLKGLPACAVPSKRTRASLRFDGYDTDTRFVPRVREEGKACTREKGAPPCKLPPWKRQRQKGARCRFHTTWLTRLLGGEREGRDEIESRERRGSRKSDPEPVDCGALARLGQSSYCNLVVPARLCAHVRVCRSEEEEETRISICEKS